MAKPYYVQVEIPLLSSFSDAANHLMDIKNKLKADGYIVTHEQVVGRGFLVTGEWAGDEDDAPETAVVNVMVAPNVEEIADAVASHTFMRRVRSDVKSTDVTARKKEVHDVVRKLVTKAPVEAVKRLLTSFEVELKASKCNPPCIDHMLLPDIVQALQEVTRSSTN